MEGVFTGMEHYRPPPRFLHIYFAFPFFGSAVERSTLNAEVSGPSPTFGAFFVALKRNVYGILVPWYAFFLVFIVWYFIVLVPSNTKYNP